MNLPIPLEDINARLQAKVWEVFGHPVEDVVMGCDAVAKEKGQVLTDVCHTIPVLRLHPPTDADAVDLLIEACVQTIGQRLLPGVPYYRRKGPKLVPHPDTNYMKLVYRLFQVRPPTQADEHALALRNAANPMPTEASVYEVP